MTRVARNMMPLPAPTNPGPENRRKGRLRPKFLTCNLGTVADLSASGVRVAAKGKVQVKPGQEIVLTLNTRHRPTAIKSSVVWVKEQSHWRHEIGLRFEEITPEIRATLNAVARECASQSTFLTGDEPEAR